MTTAEALGHGRSPYLAAYLKERQRKTLGHKLATLTKVLKRAGKARVSPKGATLRPTNFWRRAGETALDTGFFLLLTQIRLP